LRKRKRQKEKEKKQQEWQCGGSHDLGLGGVWQHGYPCRLSERKRKVGTYQVENTNYG
jgi:hypothetical protein